MYALMASSRACVTKNHFGQNGSPFSISTCIIAARRNCRARARYRSDSIAGGSALTGVGGIFDSSPFDFSAAPVTADRAPWFPVITDVSEPRATVVPTDKGMHAFLRRTTAAESGEVRSLADACPAVRRASLVR